MKPYRLPFSVIIALLLCAALAAPTVAQKKRGVKVKPKATATQAARFDGRAYGELWAVVIGINNYKHWERLDYAVNDAHSVKTLLVGHYGFRDDHVIELLDEEATLVNIRTTLGGVLPRKTNKGDGVVVFFAGHGETVDLPDGGNLGYLVPWEGSTDRNDYFATLLPMTQIREICNLIPAKHIFFIVDACYSGLAASAERGMTAETKVFVSTLAAMKSRQILTAGGRGESVIENSDWGHSAFTYKLIEALGTSAADQDQDGVITSGELATYIKARVMKLTENKQTPQFRSLTADEGEFLFISRDGTAAGTPQARDAGGDDPDKDAMKKELERLKAENEQLRKQQEEQKDQPPAEKKKDVFIPPP